MIGKSSSMKLLGALLALAIMAAGCGSGDSETATAGSGGEAPAYGSEVLEASILSGQATTVSGETFELGSLADKDLVVWFWAPW